MSWGNLSKNMGWPIGCTLTTAAFRRSLWCDCNHEELLFVAPIEAAIVGGTRTRNPLLSWLFAWSSSTRSITGMTTHNHNQIRHPECCTLCVCQLGRRNWSRQFCVRHPRYSVCWVFAAKANHREQRVGTKKHVQLLYVWLVHIVHRSTNQ